eukprot:TRINITY_DN3485_c0_g1_i2.p1 TRINITY_DN3485_c0_g1~~TRINITY_DN3485_c0_g1_i2.p1  ORF type:complete len:343 (-),score=91.72 TRINITY_DN3485_c0_g1_i2:14-1042(-)
MIVARDQNTHIETEWKKVNSTLQELEQSIKTTTIELESERKVLKDLIEKEANLSKKFHEKELEFAEVKKSLDETTKERDEYKKQNGILKDDNEKMTKDIKNITAEIEGMKHKIKMDDEEIGVIKIATYAIGGVFVLGTIDDALAHYQLWNIQAEIKKIYPYIAGFDQMSQAYENYELVTWHYKQSLTRSQCFSGFDRNMLEACKDKKPTITTITTSDGYRFGCVLNEGWLINLGKMNDPKAFTFSDAHGVIAKIEDAQNAMIVDPNYLLQFGNGDIQIASSGAGKINGKSYHIPYPFSNSTFYINGTTFHASSITIDYITVCLLYTSPSPRDATLSRMPSSA